MALPPGVETVTVVCSPPVSWTGEAATLEASITATHSLIHAPSGTPVVAFTELRTGASMTPVSIALPATDQAGFVDQSGAAFTNWAYVLRGKWLLNGERVSFVRSFQIPSGTIGPIDLDLIPDGPVSIPVTAPSTAVLTFNGRFGTVVFQESDLPERLSVESIDATVLDGIAADIANPAGALPTTFETQETAARSRVPAIVLSNYYGSYGSGNDQAAVTNAIDDAKQRGGHTVMLPAGYNPVVDQIVIPRGVEFCSSGYFQTFGRDGNVSRLIQASGINDATIVFDNDVLTQYGATRPFIGPLAIHDLVLSKPAGAGGHHIAIRTQDGREAKIQDYSTFERLGFRGGGGSGIYVNGGSPIVFKNMAGIGLGGYVLEMVDLGRDTVHGDIHQVSVANVSGDACMGYAADNYGATILLKGTRAHTVQTFRDIKSEFRVRYPSDGGDPDGTTQALKKMGNFHAIILENCASSVVVSGVGHIATGNTETTPQLRRPGNAIQVIGAARPDLVWDGVKVRVTAAQTEGAMPVAVRDDVHQVDYTDQRSEMGPQADARVPGLSTGESTMQRREITSTGATQSAGFLRLTYFTAEKTEVINSVRTLSGSTAAVGATLCRIGVYSVAANGDLTLVASTANDTALWSATSTSYGKTFTAPFTKRKRQRYAVGTLVVGASTPPNLLGQSQLLAAETALPPRLCGAVSAQTDLPSSVLAASVSDTTIQIYAALVP